jgi:hypothetical protein
MANPEYPMMATSFRSCLLKIGRAKELRDALEKYERETFAVESNRPRLGGKFDPDTEEYVLFINHMPDLGDFLDRCSLILGDTVHNLRTALDRLAYQLALLHTGGNIQRPTRVQFPICDTIGDFVKIKKAKKGPLSEIAKKHAEIMERFQGYHRIDWAQATGPYFHPVSKLRDLDNADKHRLPIDLLIPTDSIAGPTSASAIANFVMGAVEQVVRTGSYKPRVAKLGAEVSRSKFPPPASQADMDSAGYILPHIAIEGKHVAVGAVDKITAVVDQLIREFERVT